MINTFRGKYLFLSNFFIRRIYYKDHWYDSSEHAFQAQKAMNEKDRLYIASAGHPAEAKKRGKEIECRPDWDDVRVRIMADIVYQKFVQHADLKDMLLATGDQELIEGNWWRDDFWGVYNGKGLNWLGEILMEVRSVMSCG